MQKQQTKKLKHVSFLLTEVERDALKVWCFIHNTTVSQELRSLVRREFGLITPQKIGNGGAL